MSRKPAQNREIDLRGTPSTAGLEVIEYDPSAPPPAPLPLDLLAGLPGPAEAPYAEPSGDRTGTKGIWTAIEHL